MEKPSHERRLTALCQRIPKLKRSTFSRRRLVTTADFSWEKWENHRKTIGKWENHRKTIGKWRFYPLVMADSSLLKMVQSK